MVRLNKSQTRMKNVYAEGTNKRNNERALMSTEDIHTNADGNSINSRLTHIKAARFLNMTIHR